MKIVIAFLIALLVFLVLKAIRFGFKRFLKLYPGFAVMTNIILGIEYLAWIIFVFWATYWLFGEKFYYPYLVYSLILIVFGFISWFLLKDIFAGIIFKLKHNLKPGAYIQAGDISGNIKSQNVTYLKIKTDDGELFRVPYSKIIHEVISEVAYTETLKEYTLNLQVDPVIERTDAESLIRSSVMNTPWSNLKEDPHIKFIEINNDGYLFEVTLFTMSTRQVEFIEKALEEVKGVKVIS